MGYEGREKMLKQWQLKIQRAGKKKNVWGIFGPAYSNNKKES